MRRWAAAAIVALVATGFPAAAQAPLDRTPIAQLPHLTGVVPAAGGPERLYLATAGGLYLATADGAAAVLGLAAADRPYLTALAVHPNDPRRLYASGHAGLDGPALGLLVTNDSGKTWNRLWPADNSAPPPPAFRAIAASRVDPELLYAFDGTHLRVSRDGGGTWRTVSRPPAERVFGLAASSRAAEGVYLATNAGLLRSADGGRTWQPVGPPSRAATMVHMAGGDVLYTFVAGIGLLRAEEPRLDWRPVNIRFGRSAILHFAVHPYDGAVLYTILDSGNLMVSRDGGASWKPFGR
jgi:photosystem II stability/assembly factor-like uncharacterized protein